MRNLGLIFLIVLFYTDLYSQILKERILSVMDQNKELNKTIKTLNVKKLLKYWTISRLFYLRA